jgi:hypothetical protein
MSAKRENQHKKYVKVRADHMLDGSVIPIFFKDEAGDGDAYRIDRIIDMREAPSLKSGGQGVRYICRVGDSVVHLFHDDAYWFIELDG